MAEGEEEYRVMVYHCLENDFSPTELQTKFTDHS